MVNPAPIGGNRHCTKCSLEVLTHILSHLPPANLSSMALVSKHFRQLVTTPHAWRSAFSRYFPGSESVESTERESETSSGDVVASDRRLFTRLDSLSSWRNEYILRCRLLRSLGRGRPAESMRSASTNFSRSNTGQAAQITFASGLTCPVTHIHSSFGAGNRNGHIKFLHGADELGMASLSDSKSGKIDAWGSQDPVVFRQFQDIAPGEALYGLGPGDVVGMPNSMDVSQLFGMVYGEGIERNGLLWFRHTEEKRGRALMRSSGLRDLENGLPQLPEAEAICSVWIAKTPNLLELSRGAIGIMSGSSTGVVSAYSTGTNNSLGRRYERGELTYRWVVSPGVPIVSIVVDDHISQQRLSHGRTWVVILNALGEVFYLTDLPTSFRDSPSVSPAGRSDGLLEKERESWNAGSTVRWKLVEPTRRIAHIDPFSTSEVDGSYSPQLTSRHLSLNRDQIIAETLEVESFLRTKPKHFRKVCYGWDMCRRLDVDFASTDKHMAGEIVLVVGSSQQKAANLELKRYTRHKTDDQTPKFLEGTQPAHFSGQPSHFDGTSLPSESVFGGPTSVAASSWSFVGLKDGIHDASVSFGENDTNRSLIEEWHSSELSFDSARVLRVTAIAIDHSYVANLCTFEDPSESDTTISSVSNSASPPLQWLPADLRKDIPGQEARLIALGTDNGSIYLFNIRSAGPTSPLLGRAIHPVRIIHTESPQISCLGLTALYLVHGGNDGLVQAWDPLASTLEPIRTLNSRFSSRARRRLVQAAASPAGVGINLFAASAVLLDPDPTRLRGIVSLGSHLRFWSFSSDGEDSLKSNKRRLRRSERGSNQGTDRFSNTGRGALRDYIANEKLDLEREKREKWKENDRLAGRFGIDLLGPGASEDEIMAYATMLSEEAAEDDIRRRSESSGSEYTSTSAFASPSSASNDDLAEALDRSLQDSTSTVDIHSPESSIRNRHGDQFAAAAETLASPSTSSSFAYSTAEEEEDDDLRFAMRLSQAEANSRTSK